MKLCECGCQQSIMDKHRFVHGHNWRNKERTFSEEHKQKLKIARNNRSKAVNQRQAISLGENAKINPNYGMKGKHHTQKTIDKTLNSEGYKSRDKLAGVRATNSTPPWNKGRECPQLSGSNSSSWKGGISFEPYTPSFNQQLKDKVRVRDNFICQLCGIPELECGQRLDVHHIDYDKKNCRMCNLASLCRRCNVKVNFNRKEWTKYFQKLQIEKLEVL